MSSLTQNQSDDLDNYAVEDIDYPFQSPPPDLDDVIENKRKRASMLGLDEEVEVAKRVRVPRARLDETRLLSDNGIPKLRKRAADLKFRGNGHEFSDTARLLSFYQFWLDDLFPKAKFLDALAMVEKAGHKKQVALKRMDWINEGKPKLWGLDGERTEESSELQRSLADRVASVQAEQPTAQQQPKMPEGDVPDGEVDIYGATPATRACTQVQQDSGPMPDEPHDDDLDMLMAEADIAGQSQMPDLRRKNGKWSAVDFADEEAVMAEMDGLW